MTVGAIALEGAAIGVGIADDPANLDVFLRPGCAAAIWRRQIPKNVGSWLDGLADDNLPSARVVLQPSDTLHALQHLFDAVHLPEGPERTWLESDITILAEIFSDLLKLRYVRLRLDVVTTNACRKFHVDAITARLVCTYRGTGTQYAVLPQGDEPIKVFTVQRGAPILLRGSLWPHPPITGLVHRSPPIEGTGEKRLLLALDPVFDPDDAT